jgi:hypothetical protein
MTPQANLDGVPDNTSVVPQSVARCGAVDWTAAVFSAAILGGIVYGILVRGFQVGEPIHNGVGGWLPVGIVTIAMLAVGLVIVRASRTSRFRTAGAAIAAATATGGIVALEIFIAWGVNQIV